MTVQPNFESILDAMNKNKAMINLPARTIFPRFLGATLAQTRELLAQPGLPASVLTGPALDPLAPLASLAFLEPPGLPGLPGAPGLPGSPWSPRVVRANPVYPPNPPLRVRAWGTNCHPPRRSRC